MSNSGVCVCVCVFPYVYKLSLYEICIPHLDGQLHLFFSPSPFFKINLLLHN